MFIDHCGVKNTRELKITHFTAIIIIARLNPVVCIKTYLGVPIQTFMIFTIYREITTEKRSIKAIIVVVNGIIERICEEIFVIITIINFHIVYNVCNATAVTVIKALV
jgi:hypothetical protein